jgi:inner membrane protease subunit 1
MHHRFASFARRVAAKLPAYRLPRVREVVEVVGTCAVVYGFTEYGYQVTLCIGPSMEPTFDTDGELAVLEKYSLLPLWNNPIRKGEVVVATCPTNIEKRVCKRVLALENELVVREQLFGPTTYTIVPPGHVYLKGDNPYNSTGTFIITIIYSLHWTVAITFYFICTV